jgi:hypothetical protein
MVDPGVIDATFRMEFLAVLASTSSCCVRKCKKYCSQNTWIQKARFFCFEHASLNEVTSRKKHGKSLLKAQEHSISLMGFE